MGKGSVWQLPVCEIMPMSQSSSTIFGGTTKHQVTMLKDRGVFARQYYRQKPLINCPTVGPCFTAVKKLKKLLFAFASLSHILTQTNQPPKLPPSSRWVLCFLTQDKRKFFFFFQERRAFAQSWGNGVAASDGELSRKFK